MVGSVRMRPPRLKCYRSAPRRSWICLTPLRLSSGRPLFAAAIYTGLRKGELLGLQKSKVDLRDRLLYVARSYDRATNKSKREEVIPIATELVPFLELAIKASKSELVFPRPDGSMMKEDVDTENVLRRALARAGIVLGYDHACRRKGAAIRCTTTTVSCAIARPAT